jgi:hypothetical protein
MTYISGHDRSQILLLPEAVDDYVGPDNPVRFIDAFVDGLDLAAASFSGVEPKVTGRPGYAPADLLKLYIYGYLNRVRSSPARYAPTEWARTAIALYRQHKADRIVAEVNNGGDMVEATIRMVDANVSAKRLDEVLRLSRRAGTCPRLRRARGGADASSLRGGWSHPLDLMRMGQPLYSRNPGSIAAMPGFRQRKCRVPDQADRRPGRQRVALRPGKYAQLLRYPHDD